MSGATTLSRRTTSQFLIAFFQEQIVMHGSEEGAAHVGTLC